VAAVAGTSNRLRITISNNIKIDSYQKESDRGHLYQAGQRLRLGVLLTAFQGRPSPDPPPYDYSTAIALKLTQKILMPQ
jgi:hypothetical protein